MKRPFSFALAFCLLMVSVAIAARDDQKIELASSQTSRGLTDAIQPIELVVDDGSFEDAIGLTFGGTLSAVNRLTPPRYPAKLKQVKVYFSRFTRVAAGDPFTLLFAPNESGDDDITHVTFQTLNTTILGIDQFLVYDVPEIMINSGDFVVGFRITHPRGQFPISLDSTAPLNQRSYVAGAGFNYTHIENANLALIGNFGIRAMVNLVQTCSYTLSAAAQEFSSNGGTGSFNVTTSLSDCAWTAATGASWITITSGSGTGAGTVSFAVATNSGSARAASITVAGQVFTVTQAGIPLPTIRSASASGKKLTVTGENFDIGAAILVNDKPAKKVSNDADSPTTILISKKAGNTIDPGQTVTLVVRNANGLMSAPFSYTRPN